MDMRLPGSIAVLCTAALLLAEPAAAQLGSPGGPGAGMVGGGMGGGMMGGPGMSMGGGGAPRERAVAPPPPRLTATGPRLEPGALFCRTLEDLRRRIALQSGAGAPGGPAPSCRTLPGVLPITVVGRAGPGATQVQTAGTQPETGWTDAWLPERAGGASTPAQAAPGGRRGP
ncbi:hypothetical protein [Muricoccus aerilatus]|uniref:hypothetical protein n=1 Tax=Muricoccus aerilatus TaxID=452982 RepID=UPI0005C1E4B2|nr:hypothetical protein [Roseomonas aerilata]